MFEITNYIFLNKYSKVTYDPNNGLHIFIKHETLPKVKLGKKGIIHFKNGKKLKKITCFSISKKGIRKSEVKLNPGILKECRDNNISISFNNTEDINQRQPKLIKLDVGPKINISHPVATNTRFNKHTFSGKEILLYLLKKPHITLFKSWKKI